MLLGYFASSLLVTDALASAEENVAASRRALEEAARQHEEHFEELGGLMDRAVELGLKSKVRGGGKVEREREREREGGGGRGGRGREGREEGYKWKKDLGKRSKMPERK